MVEQASTHEAHHQVSNFGGLHTYSAEFLFLSAELGAQRVPGSPW